MAMHFIPHFAHEIYSFAKAFSKLIELGVPTSQWATPQPWEMKTLDEQEAKPA